LGLADLLSELPVVFKIGKQLFTAEGPVAVREVAKRGRPIFLDLKYHDIPNTVAGAVRAAVDLAPLELLNIHALGGREMMKAAVAARNSANSKARILGVTILTSMDARALREVGVTQKPATEVTRLAKLAKAAGLDGVVCSAQESAALRKALGPDFILLNGGIRPALKEMKKDDQARVATPGFAVAAGSNYLVVGRPISAATDPLHVARAVLDEIAAAQNESAESQSRTATSI
jgi:orotidine-5'-phosphate decarboxylase